MTSIIHRNRIVDEIKYYRGEDSFHNPNYTTLGKNIPTRYSAETHYIKSENSEDIKTTAKFLFDSDIGNIPSKSKIIMDNTEYIVEDTNSPPGIEKPLYVKVLCRRLDNAEG